MSGKSELVERIIGGAKDYGRGLLKTIGNPLDIMSRAAPGALERTVGGAALGGIAGAGINLSTGIAGSVLSPITGGLFTNSGEGVVNANYFSMGSVVNSGIKGAIAGGALFGGGFKRVGSGLEMRSGLRAVSNWAGDVGAKMGIGAKAGSALEQTAMKGGLKNSIGDLFKKSGRFLEDKLPEGAAQRGVAGHRIGKVNTMANRRSEAVDRLGREEGLVNKWYDPEDMSQVDNQLARKRKQEIGNDYLQKKKNHKNYKDLTYTANGPAPGVKRSDGSFNAKVEAEIENQYAKQKSKAERAKANISKTRETIEANDVGNLQPKLKSNEPVNRKEAVKNKWQDIKSNKATAAGAALTAGGLGMTLYQTNALGISIPSNRGYR